MVRFLKGKKTFILMLLAVISIVISFFTDQMNMTESIAAIIAAFGVGSLRSDMIPALSFMAKYKSYFVMAGGIITAVIGLATGGLSLIGFITAIIAACGLGSFSAGIRKFIS